MLAGGEGARFDPAAPPGSGTWRGAVVQVAIDDDSGLGRAAMARAFRAARGHVRGRAPRRRSSPDGRASSAPGSLAAGVRLIDLGETDPDVPAELAIASGGAPIVVLGDPDAWQADGRCSAGPAASGRSCCTPPPSPTIGPLTRSRELPPPLGTRPGECWLVRDGVTVRAILPTRTAERRESGEGGGELSVARPCASATGWLTTRPACTLSPRARAASALNAARHPESAIARTYGSVTLVSA